MVKSEIRNIQYIRQTRSHRKVTRGGVLAQSPKGQKGQEYSGKIRKTVFLKFARITLVLTSKK